MDEMNTNALELDSAPQENNAEATDEATNPEEAQSTTSEATDGQGTEQNDSTDNQEQTNTDENGDGEASFLMVRYNHETKNLSQSEARTLAQKAMQAEPLMNELRYLAAQAGEKSVKSFIENLKVTSEEQRRDKIRNQLVDQGNEDLFNSIFDAETSRIQNAAGVMLEDESRAFNEEIEGEHIRLAADFKDLQAEFPDIKEVKDIPDQVLRLAVEKNISLLDAQLRFNYAESKKINNAKKSAAAAAESSAGSVKSDETNSTSPVIEAMRKGLWH